MKRRTFLGGTIAVTTLGLTSSAGAEQPPIKIGMSMALTGGLGLRPHRAAAKTLMHYRRKVRANQRRLLKA